jgi:hypothetical protein
MPFASECEMVMDICGVEIDLLIVLELAVAVLPLAFWPVAG